MDQMSLIAFASAGALVLVAVLLIVKLRSTSAQLRAARGDLARYAPITDVEQQVAVVQKALAAATAERDAFLADDQKRRAELNAQYQEALATYQRLRAEVSSLEENIEAMSFGLYKPHYTFDSSQGYKDALDRVYEQKKDLIKKGGAAYCPVEWQVNNSKAEGKRMTKQNMKVMLRAFNGEVDAAVAKVTWNNVTRMEERIRKAFDAINASGTANQISVTQPYLALALDELRLTHEYEQKKYEEREEQRALREQMREEERALREAERAQQEAASEEARYEKAMEKARAEVEKATGEKLAKANEKLHELEQKLAEAQEKMQRAKSLAELTRSGYVYIISNVGTMGDGTFKIGMTRRLDPMDRVSELGDASVPFPFDVHAMIYSEDAPTLENAFHREFAARRVNLVNMRKEYFLVTLDEIEAFAKKRSVTVEFTKLAEAREYRETLAMRQQHKGNGVPAPGNGAPVAGPGTGAAPAEGKEPEAFPSQLLAS